MKNTNASTGKRELSFKEISALMKLALPTPCQITSKPVQSPTIEEVTEWYGTRNPDATDRSSPEETD